MQVRQGCRSSPEKARPDDMCRIYGSLSVFAKNVNKSLSFIYILQLSPTSTACQAPRVRVFHQLPFNTKIQQLHGEQSLIKEAQTSHPLYTKNAMQPKAMLLFCQAGEVLPIFSYKTSTSAMAFIITFSSAISKQKKTKNKIQNTTAENQQVHSRCLGCAECNSGKC